MPLPPYARFRGITFIGESTESPQLAYNLKEFFNWCLLNIGGFNNVTRPAPGDLWIGKAHILKPSIDDRYTTGKVWETFRPDLVWEKNFDAIANPIPITGVYVDNVLMTTGFSVNYPLGQIIFDTPVATNSAVQLEYSYRMYHITTSDDASWWRELMFGAWVSEDPDFWEVDTGAQAILSKNRIPLPAVVIEPVPRRTSVGYELGGGSWVYQDVLFHIYSRTPWERDKIVDIIHKQKEKTIWTFNKNKMVENGDWPLTDGGDLKPSPLMYPDMVKVTADGGYFWRELTFSDTNGQDVQSVPGLYRAIIRVTCELTAPAI